MGVVTIAPPSQPPQRCRWGHLGGLGFAIGLETPRRLVKVSLRRISSHHRKKSRKLYLGAIRHVVSGRVDQTAVTLIRNEIVDSVADLTESGHRSRAIWCVRKKQAPALITLYRKSVELVLLVIGRDPLILWWHFGTRLFG